MARGAIDATMPRMRKHDRMVGFLPGDCRFGQRTSRKSPSHRQQDCRTCFKPSVHPQPPYDGPIHCLCLFLKSPELCVFLKPVSSGLDFLTAFHAPDAVYHTRLCGLLPDILNTFPAASCPCAEHWDARPQAGGFRAIFICNTLSFTCVLLYIIIKYYDNVFFVVVPRRSLHQVHIYIYVEEFLGSYRTGMQSTYS